jgi:tripartite-type tricarboxylate transporter receptor subunit TctC
MATAGTPPEVLQTLHDEIYRILQLPDVAPKLDELGVRRQPMSTGEFAQFIRAENESYREIARITGVRID